MKDMAAVVFVILLVAVLAYSYGRYTEQRRIHRDCWTAAQFSVGPGPDETFSCVSVSRRTIA